MTKVDSLSSAHTANADNIITGLDPRTRIVMALAFAIAIVMMKDFAGLGMALGLSFTMMFAARLPFIATLKKVMAMDGFIIFMLVMLPFTTPGEVIFTAGPFEGTREGLHKAIVIALKANAIVMMLLALVGTIEAARLGHALHCLKVPETLVHLLLFTVRYIDVLRQEYSRLRTAMKARGFRPGNNRHTYRSIGYLLGMMLVRSLERSERILQAMKCRGFQGNFYLLAEFDYGKRDIVFGALMIAAITALIIWEIAHAPV